jgi:iron complex transport system substrate-binding protein
VIKEKVKTKILVLVEIAIVLCSVFLVALPTIAADQTTQKTITTASEDDFTLEIYGNANEDDTIDMRDTTYIKLVIFGKKPKTDLADANYDGKVRMLDVGQTKLIILGKEKKLTFIDIFGEAETVNKPIKRLANWGNYGIQVTRALNAKDILLPLCGSMVQDQPVFFPEMSKWESPGYIGSGFDFEMVLDLNPDAAQTNMEIGGYYGPGARIERKRLAQEKLPGIPLISLDFRTPDALLQSVRTYGYIIDRREEAQEFFDWLQGNMEAFETRIEGIPEDEKPRYFIAGGTDIYATKSSKDRRGMAMTMGGGHNIVDDIPNVHHSPKVDPEWVIEQNPEYIFRIMHPGTLYAGGYEAEDRAGIAAVRQEILDLPGLSEVDAVKNKRVYVIDGTLNDGGGNTIIGTAYAAKLFYPDLFNDVDPQEIHQEYLDKFCHIDFDVREQGVFVYPPYEEWSVVESKEQAVR